MKKLSLILAGTVLFGSLSFASHVVKQDSKAPATQQKTKPATKVTKAQPGKATPAPANSGKGKKPPVKKGIPSNGTAK